MGIHAPQRTTTNGSGVTLYGMDESGDRAMIVWRIEVHGGDDGGEVPTAMRAAK
jgi:hypothetical protein